MLNVERIMRENGVFGQIYKNIQKILVTLVNAASIPVPC